MFIPAPVMHADTGGLRAIVSTRLAAIDFALVQNPFGSRNHAVTTQACAFNGIRHRDLL